MKLPQLAILEFLDHCKYSGDAENIKPLSCELFGVIYKQDKLAYYVATWVSDKTIDDNTEYYVILKKVITKITKVKRK